MYEKGGPCIGIGIAPKRDPKKQETISEKNHIVVDVVADKIASFKWISYLENA